MEASKKRYNPLISLPLLAGTKFQNIGSRFVLFSLQGLDAEFKIPQSEVKDRRPIRKPVMSLTSFPGAQPIALVYEFPQILQSSMGEIIR